MTNPLTPEELAAIREQFEAWYATPENGATLHDEHQFRRYPEDNPELPGEYTNWEVDLAWRAWQAALEARHGCPRCEAELEQLKRTRTMLGDPRQRVTVPTGEDTQ